MWIITQNKEDLIKCQKISIIGPDKDVYLLVELTNDNYIELGIYKSRERALEVLDEIQKLLIALPRTEIPFNDVVYQMPEEWLNDRSRTKSNICIFTSWV